MFSKAGCLFHRFTSSLFFCSCLASLWREFTLEMSRHLTPKLCRQIADSISYISMMNGFEITGDWQQALQLLQHVQHEKLEADCFFLLILVW